MNDRTPEFERAGGRNTRQTTPRMAPVSTDNDCYSVQVNFKLSTSELSTVDSH